VLRTSHGTRVVHWITPVLFLAIALFLLSSLTRAQSSPPTFGQPTISGIQGVGFEQDIRLDPTNANRMYTSVPGALSSDTSWIWHSEDGGKTFKWVVAAAPKNGKPDVCAGGGDTELAIDAAGSLYFNDLTLANFSTGRSDDAGDSMACSNTGVPDGAVDRQWYAIDGDPKTGTGLDNGAGHNIYLVNDEIGPGAPLCNGTVANNVLAMYRSPVPGGAALAGIEFGPANKVSGAGTCNEAIMGNVELAPVATRTGKLNPGPTTLAQAVKHVYVIHDDAALSRILIGRCFPVLFGAPVPNVSDPSGLNCDDLQVASFPGFKTGGNFPSLAIDKAGNLYAVWEQAPVDASGVITGDTILKYSYSTDEGSHWSAPVTIPTPGLHNNVFAWAAAGDNGRVDIAWYGTPTAADPANPTCGTSGGGVGGPDATTNGIWSLYMTQTLNGHAAAPTFTAPVLAGEHYIHKGTIQTVMGGQCGDRTLGDFIQLRIGSRGEAHISYSDSNNANESSAPHGMYVRQNGGTGVFAGTSTGGDPILLNAASDPAGDGKRETDGISGPNNPSLDILQSSMSKPDPANCHPAGAPCYRVKMTVNNLTIPTVPAPDAFAVWLTQWLVPAATACDPTVASCRDGGKNPFVYLKSDGTCWSGENAVQRNGGGVMLTYPGGKAITAPGACSYTPGPLGTIAIDVPVADVSLPAGVAPLSNRLYSVTASTMTMLLPPEDPPAVAATIPVGSVTTVNVRRLGGQPFDLIDVVRAYDFVPGTGGGGGCRSADGDGDEPGRDGGRGHFHFHHDNCNQHPDADDFSDPGAGVDFHSTQVASVTYDDVAHTVTIAGVGTDNGAPVAFTIIALDSALAAPGLYSITLSDGYANSGSLVAGSIALH
jgi:hypothetical protein